MPRVLPSPKKTVCFLQPRLTHHVWPKDFPLSLSLWAECWTIPPVEFKTQTCRLPFSLNPHKEVKYYEYRIFNSIYVILMRQDPSIKLKLSFFFEFQLFYLRNT